MSVGRVVSSVVSCVAVVGCAAVVVGMTRAASSSDDERAKRAAASPTRTERPAYLPGPSTAAARDDAVASTTPVDRPATTAAARPSSSPVVVPASATASATSTSAAAPAPRPTSAAPARPAARTTTAAPRSAAPAAPRPAAATGHALPLRYSTGNATRVITVTAGSAGSTYARVQAWTKVSAGKWKKYGAAVTANVGSDGIGQASESRSKTPAGSFTLTHAFGRLSDPGTALPYFRTNPSDYWISSPGPKYNTHQRCGSCGYNNGVNERLYYVNPQYNYSVLIDYNTRNAPGGVKQGEGSAFFLHVSSGEATAGCVAIPQSKLVSLMKWLSPKAHPRILIGVV